MSSDFTLHPMSFPAVRASCGVAALVGLALIAVACADLGPAALPASAAALADVVGRDSAARSRGIARLRELAEAGDAESQQAFAVIQARGMTGEVDVRVANFWWRHAAEQGVARAQYSYGESLRQGRGIALDSKEAIRWMTRAAKQGHPIAQYDIAFAHTVGFGTTRDLAVARTWFEKSARAGHVEARAGLVRLYADETEAFYNPQLALIWLESVEPHRALFSALAQEQMDAHREKLESRLSASEREEARREADALQRRHPVLEYSYWDEAFLEGLKPQ